MLTLGIDIGTSGVRGSVVDAQGRELAHERIALPPAQAPGEWKDTTGEIVRRLCGRVDARRIRALAVDGTSATVLLCDDAGAPRSPVLMYHEQGCAREAETIARFAPADSPAQGAGSSLAKALHLLADAPQASRIAHQADWISGWFSGNYGFSDENNCLKLGYDPAARAWPEWIAQLGIPAGMLPRVRIPGSPVGRIDPEVAGMLGLPRDCTVAAGTTDSIAAFIATSARDAGDAVTSLGSTLVIKQVARQPVFSARHGVYSHRLGDAWLAGGASNAGGKALLGVFSQQQLDALTPRLDPDRPTGLNLYPLPKPGERFPVYDPGMRPVMDPRPDDDAVYLQALLEGLADIEARGYALLEQLGAGKLGRVYTSGGGSASEPWRKIREARLGVPVLVAEHSEASYGAAVLARLALHTPPGNQGPGSGT